MNISKAIMERRSIRKYENREIPRELLNEILEEAFGLLEDRQAKLVCLCCQR